MAGTCDFGNLRFWKNVRVPFFKNPQQHEVLKMPPFSGSKIPRLAIHKIISHIWEDRSRKVNMNEPDLRFFHGNFWPVISRTVRKPCFSTSIPAKSVHPGPKLGPSQKFETQKIKQNKILKIKIRVAQNVGKVWIGRKKNLPAPFGAIPGNFLRGPEKLKKCIFFVYFPRFATQCLRGT